jgi:L-malate glycosyltransferase
MQRVAFCIDNMNVGGTEMNAVRTAARLLERGVDLSVFSLAAEGALLERYAALGVPVHPLPLDRLYGMTAARRGREMTAIIRRDRIGIVHAHDFYSNIFAGPWARLAGARFIASRRWWEGPDRARRWANRCSYVLADRVLANSPAVAHLLTRTERVRAGAVVVVPNFLDDDAFDPPPAGWTAAFAAGLGLPEDAVVVGVVASLSPIKDHATLLRAVAALAPAWPALHLVLVGGDGGSRAALERLAGSLGIADRVRFAGLQPNMPSPHHAFDIAALTSVSEGLPNSILEAMAAGRPVVATRVGAIPDAVEDGVTGFLEAPGDHDAIAARLAALLGDSDLRRELGDRARVRARERYSADAALDALLAAYAAVARAHGPDPVPAHA